MKLFSKYSEFQPVTTIPQRLRRTDGRPICCSNTALRVASRGKKNRGDVTQTLSSCWFLFSPGGRQRRFIGTYQKQTFTYSGWKQTHLHLFTYFYNAASLCAVVAIRMV